MLNDIPTWIIVVTLIILSPWILGGIITIAIAAFGLGAAATVVILTVLQPVTSRYNRSEFAKQRRRKKIAKRQQRRRRRP